MFCNQFPTRRSIKLLNFHDVLSFVPDFYRLPRYDTNRRAEIIKAAITGSKSKLLIIILKKKKKWWKDGL